ncbi:MAG: hypothetical protein HPY82_19370 [Gammaproteobacteria bacterium]|nr:hypothetical protein [Gammaproteobacteria bacterium]
MSESRNFYIYVGSGVRDWLIDEFDQGKDLGYLKKQLKQRADLKVGIDQVAEAVVLSYVDAGESERAYQIASAFRDQMPSANMHNLVIKCLLSSWEYTQTGFLEESRRWAALYANEFERPELSCRNEKPRIGFVCDYGSTVFGENAIFPMCHVLGMSGLDVYYYNFERVAFNISGDSIRIRNVHTLSVNDLSRAIRDDRIDILIDLNGRLREHHRLGVFALRSAPVQINYFNLVGTMGMKNYDYIIADETQVPDRDFSFYTEKVLRLPCGANGAFAFKRDVDIPLPEARTPGRPFTFASFNAFFKINTVLLETWAEILRRVPDSIIVIKCQETARDRVIRKIARVFGRAGVDLNRVMIEGWSSLHHLRRQYGEVDLCLDTFPYSGGSTTLNALWQGVPVLSWCGEGWRARTSASMLHAAGMEALVMGSRQEYVEKAVSLAMGSDGTRLLRRDLADSINRNPYFSPDRVYQELADALRSVWQSSLNRQAAPDLSGQA